MKLVFNICLALLGFGAIILEFFVPSAGIIGIVGTGCVITGIVFTYTNYGLMAGTIFLVACAVIGPFILFSYFKIFPKSFMGKRLILNNKMDKEKGFVSGESENYKNLLNSKGVTETKLRPIGKALIGDKSYNVTTLGEFINKNTKIKVIQIEGNRIVVTSEES